jgi:hypothetical protein
MSAIASTVRVVVGGFRSRLDVRDPVDALFHPNVHQVGRGASTKLASTAKHPQTTRLPGRVNCET